MEDARPDVLLLEALPQVACQFVNPQDEPRILMAQHLPLLAVDGHQSHQCHHLEDHQRRCRRLHRVSRPLPIQLLCLLE
jgi:hypothetical protein